MQVNVVKPNTRSSLINACQDDARLIVVTGTYRGGRRRFVTSLTGREPILVSLKDYFGEEVAESYLGTLTLADETRLHLLTTAGAVNGEQMYVPLRGYCVGVIILFDNTRPDTFREAKAVQRTVLGQSGGLPYVMAANPHDGAERAWTLDELRPALRLGEDEVLVGCDAADARSCAKVVLRLIECMPESDYSVRLAAALRQIS